MKEHYVSLEQAKRLHELGFDGVDKYYVTESFCYNGDPNDYYAEGMLVDEYIVYFVNENNEDDYRGIPAPRLDQASKWLRDCKHLHIIVIPFYYNPAVFMYKSVVRNEFDWNKKYEMIFNNSYESALSAGISKALELLGKEEE